MRRSLAGGFGLLMLVSCVGLAACNDDEEGTPADGAGGSAGTGGADAGADAADATPDTSEASTDATQDTTDAPTEAATDAADDATDAADDAADAADDTTDAADDTTDAANDAPDAADDTTDAADAADDTTDAATDAPADVASDASTVPTCGTAPYQRFDPVTVDIIGDLPATDVTVGVSICPGTTLSLPDLGTGQIDIQRNVPFHFTGTQAGNLPSLSIEYNIQLAALPKVPGGLLVFAPTYPAIVIPGWDASKHALIGAEIVSTKSGATSPCDDKAGVTFTVVGHPEAIVSYGGNGTSTGSGGDARGWIAIETTGTVAAPEFVTITATKAGCSVGIDAVSAFFRTGRVPAAVNAVTSSAALEIGN